MRRSFKKFICSLVVATAVMSATPCVNGLGLETTITAEAASRTVALSKKTVSVAVAGKSTVQLKNTNAKKKVTWSSSNKKVATVKAGKNGKVTITGKKAGKATITGKYAGKKYTVKVTVKAPALSKKSLSLTAGKSGTITLSNTVSSKKLTWKSSKTSVATVKAGKSGKVTITGKKAGTANITATYNGKKYTCKVTVKGKAAAPKLSSSSLNLTAGKSGSVTLDNPVKGKGVTAKSSNTKVVTVKVSSNKITISAKSKGTATVTVSHNGKSYKCTVKVAAKATTTPVKQPETQPSTEPSKETETNAPTKPSTEPSKPTQPSTEPQKPVQPSTEPEKETGGQIVDGGEGDAIEPEKGSEGVGDKTTEPDNQKPDEGNNGNDNNGGNNGNGGDTLKQWYEAPIYSCFVEDKNTLRMVISNGTGGAMRTFGTQSVATIYPHYFDVEIDCTVTDDSPLISYKVVRGTGNPDGSTAAYCVQYFRGTTVGKYSYQGKEVTMFRLSERTTCLANGKVTVRTEFPVHECRVLVCQCGAEFHSSVYSSSYDAWCAHTDLTQQSCTDISTYKCFGNISETCYYH